MSECIAEVLELYGRLEEINPKLAVDLLERKVGKTIGHPLELPMSWRFALEGLRRATDRDREILDANPNSFASVSLRSALTMMRNELKAILDERG